MFAPSFPFVIIDPQFYRDRLRPGSESEAGRGDGGRPAPDEPGHPGSPSGPGAWHTLPSWYAVSAADRVIDPNLQRFMAQRAGSTAVQFDDASHAGGSPTTRRGS